MLKHKRPLLIGMAGEANSILRRRSAHLLCPNRAMHIVAVRTLHQALVDAMVKRHFELRLLLRMAGVTKLRLRFHQQKLFGLRMMRRMAGNAADVVLRMDRVDGIHVLRATSVTSQAASVDFLRSSILEQEYFRFVAAAGHMVGAGAMAALATLLRRTAQFIQRGLPVRRFLPRVVKIFVTSLASLRSHVLGDLGGRRTNHGCAGGLCALSRRRRSLAQGNADDENRQCRECKNPMRLGTSFRQQIFPDIAVVILKERTNSNGDRYATTVPYCSRLRINAEYLRRHLQTSPSSLI